VAVLRSSGVAGGTFLYLVGVDGTPGEMALSAELLSALDVAAKAEGVGGLRFMQETRERKGMGSCQPGRLGTPTPDGTPATP
jgi:hypothetical protein